MSYDLMKGFKRMLKEGFFGSFPENLESLVEYRFPDKELAEITTKEGIAAMDTLVERKEEE